ncbi:hypothetical protein C8Q80DRAFT_1075562, partial [Daedaleopsis nitida]
EVLLQLDNWTRYKLDSPEPWKALFPGGGVVHLGAERTPYTVSMLHQLRCVDAIREQLTRTRGGCDIEPTRHCLNYLRQTLMCRPDIYLDSYQYLHKVNPAEPFPTRKCKNWTLVYEIVKDNQ